MSGGTQSNRACHVVMYHYVRDLPNSTFPRIKGMLLDDFRKQVATLADQHEMATLESAMSFLSGQYHPRRDLCLLSFDDGLREHYQDVTPILADYGIEGLFFIVTACQEHARVAPVHMNHFLTAELGFETYRQLFLDRLSSSEGASEVDHVNAARTYPWDKPEVAAFKYLFNFVLSPETRDAVVGGLFSDHLGDEAAFARDLYFSWDEAQAMQNAGMLMGGHTHEHRALARLTDDELQADLRTCKSLLQRRLNGQHLWPFCYPYGKQDSFDGRAKELLRRLSFHCALSTETGSNQPGSDPFSLRRVDCNRATEHAVERAS